MEIQGLLIGAGLGYMLGDQKDAKKVASREVWAVGGAALGHLLQDQIGPKPAPAQPQVVVDPGLSHENARLKRALVETRANHSRTLAQIETQVDELLAEREEAPAPRVARAARQPAAEPAPRRRVVSLGTMEREAAPSPAPKQAPKAAVRRPQLPDYGQLDGLRGELAEADLAEVFGRSNTR